MQGRACVRKRGVLACIAALVLVPAFPAAAQWRPRVPGTIGESNASASLSGELETGARLIGGLTVELYDDLSHTTVARTTPFGSGTFEFNMLPPGDYRLRVLDTGGAVLREQQVRVLDGGSYVRVSLPELRRERPGAGTISVNQLRHKPPRKAAKEFERGTQAQENGDQRQAVAHLKKALETDPGFVEAYNNLGTAYMRQHQFEAALEQFQKAAALDPDCEPVAANLALAYVVLNRLPEGEQAARRAVKLDASSVAARYALGISLFLERRRDAETRKYLEDSADRYPQARLALAELLGSQGQRQEAAGELKKYLAEAKAPEQDRIRRWLAELEK